MTVPWAVRRSSSAIEEFKSITRPVLPNTTLMTCPSKRPYTSWGSGTAELLEPAEKGGLRKACRWLKRQERQERHGSSG